MSPMAPRRSCVQKLHQQLAIEVKKVGRKVLRGKYIMMGCKYLLQFPNIRNLGADYRLLYLPELYVRTVRTCVLGWGCGSETAVK
jgi:hypothetical protein